MGADLFVYFLKQLLVQSAQLAGKSQDSVFITVDAQLLCQLRRDLSEILLSSDFSVR